MEIDWKVQLGLFLVPTAIYGLMFFGQHFPKSEASNKGLRLGGMMQQIGFCGAAVVGYLLYLFCRDTLGGTVLYGLSGSEFFVGNTWLGISAAIGLAFVVWVAVITKLAPGHWMMVALFIAHALVGAVELGTDQWIQNINGNILTPEQGNILFIFTSMVMFALRFCAHFIEKRLGLSPVGILLVCAILAAVGLILSSTVNTLTMAFLALTIYAVGKTFFWPTMLAVASDRFPRTGAVAISMMGGIGMLSAGLIGSPGLGYFKDRYTTEAISETNAAVLESNKAQKPSKWLGFEAVRPLDGSKLEAAKKVEKDKRSPAESAMVEAEIAGSRKALKVDALIPCGMAVIYLILLLYFKGIGGYRPVSIEEQRT
jgi:hypothetical protein